MNQFLEEFLDALDAWKLELEDALAEEPGHEVHRLADLERRDIELLDELFPELAFACENRWVLELTLKYCDLREKKGRT